MSKLLCEGKTKQVFPTDEEHIVCLTFKDTITAFNCKKKADIKGKGALNNGISSIFFRVLAESGISNHFIKKVSSYEQHVQKLNMIPLEVVVRNVSQGSIHKRLGISKGKALNPPIVEFYWKQDELDDPLVNESHIRTFRIASQEQIDEMKPIALKVNEVLKDYLLQKKVILADFKLEFGVDKSGEVMLGDEISPDTCRFIDQETKRTLDKDRFREDLSGVKEAYQEVYLRLGGEGVYV